MAWQKQTLEMIAAEDRCRGRCRTVAPRGQALSAGYVKPTSASSTTTKISDHFAIIPTLQAPKALTEIEAKLYDLVVKRFIAVFYPSAEFMVTTRVTQGRGGPANAPFPDQRQGAGQSGLDGGLRQRKAAGEDANLVAVRPGETVVAEEVACRRCANRRRATTNRRC